MSVHSSASSQRTDTPQLSAEDQAELATLPTLLKQWRGVQEEKQKLIVDKRRILEGIRESDKRSEVLEKMILPIMDKLNIGALDMKQSNARAIRKRSQRKVPIPKKELPQLVAQHLKSEEVAKGLLEFLDTKRETKVKESLVYEKNETPS
jgi:hypothetical protein